MDLTEFLPSIWRPKFKMVPIYDIIFQQGHIIALPGGMIVYNTSITVEIG